MRVHLYLWAWVRIVGVGGSVAYLAAFNLPCRHYHHFNVVRPKHPPEVNHSVRERTFPSRRESGETQSGFKRAYQHVVDTQRQHVLDGSSLQLFLNCTIVRHHTRRTRSFTDLALR